MKHYPHTFSGRQASQSEFELTSFIELLQENKVTSYLEIGARDGDTFHEIVSSLPFGSTAIAVDLPGGLWGKRTTRANLLAAVGDLQRKGYNVEVFFGDSRHGDIINTVNDLGPYDAMLIDGDHTYEGVKADWLNYGHLSTIVAFHDIVGFEQSEKVFGHRVEVPKLWQEISDKNSLEFIDQDSKMGIGVWRRR